MKIKIAIFVLLIFVTSGQASSDKEDFKEMKSVCDAGYMQQWCSSVGYSYEFGVGVEKNYSKAAKYYSKACDAGVKKGCTSLGLLYITGRGVNINFTKSKNLFIKACNSNNAFGCDLLGYSYEHGKGVEKNHRKAKKFYKKSCDGGLEQGCKDYARLTN